MPAEKPTVDYVAMTGPELLTALGDNGYAWAEAFCQIKKARGWTLDEIDEGLMVAWFANAIEGATQVRQARAEAALRGVTSPVVQSLTN